MRFVIYGMEYGDASAGVRALNRLCHWLSVLGHDASLSNCYRTHPEWECKRWDGEMTIDTIAVYGETVHGNPLKAQRSTRWAMYHAGALGSPQRPSGPARYGPHDRLYYYSEIYRDSCELVEHVGGVKRLYVSVFEPHILYSWDGPRTINGFWVGRGVDNAERNRDVIPVDEMYEYWPIFRTRADLAKMLRRTKSFYTFDPLSAFPAEAMLCGCDAYVIEESGSIRRYKRADPEMLHAFDMQNAFLEPGDVLDFVRDMENWS